jgi:hypothetical protein
MSEGTVPGRSPEVRSDQEEELPPLPRKRRGAPPKPIVDRPTPLWEAADAPDDFPSALDLQMRRYGDTPHYLERVFASHPHGPNKTTFRMWRTGLKLPSTPASFEILSALDARYGLPPGSFRAKLPASGQSAGGHRLPGVTPHERRRLSWHLPDDFDGRPVHERAEILAWVRTVIVAGATGYRRYQADALQHRYGLQFPGCDSPGRAARSGPRRSRVTAPPSLAREMAELVRFKTRVLTEAGYQRSGVWGPETVAQRAEHLGLMFGAMTACPHGPVKGLGARREDLTLALLVSPKVWDWYLAWREQRRGFFTAWEVDMLQLGAAFSRRDTGWLRQTPSLAQRLTPIPGLIDAEHIHSLRADWGLACDEAHRHARVRIKEVERVARVHRDPFEPILAILDADSPLLEYRRIAEEIIKRSPDRRRYPTAAAEATRGALMIRLGLHLGLRQKNLRQLLVRPRGATPMTERRLEDLKRGELRWSERDQAWEVFIPAVAFKNAGSSYFGAKPFRLLLPNLAGLHPLIDTWLDHDRPRLLGAATDPGTFFIKTVKRNSRDAAYNQTTFYEAWRLITQRYGVYNPYTGKGAIKGLLPHGPHNVRDVLATHILKQTGSYEQASYAIQDTVETVANHYGRFLPQDKAALAAQVLNKVWEANP